MRGRHVLGLAAVGGACERKLLLGQGVAVRRARFHQHERLQRLDGGARKNRALDVAERQHGAAVGIDHRDGAAMAALDHGAAQNFDQNGIAHLADLNIAGF